MIDVKKEIKIRPTIGMSMEDVLNFSWGEPETKNITETENGVCEQWCYSLSQYLYFENGIVTAVQYSE